MPFLMGSEGRWGTVEFATKLALIFTVSLANLGLCLSLKFRGSTGR